MLTILIHSGIEQVLLLKTNKYFTKPKQFKPYEVSAVVASIRFKKVLFRG